MKWFSITPLALLIAACGPSSPVSEDANDTASLPNTARTAPDATTGPPTNATATSLDQAQPAAGAVIPAPLHGRWGMTPQDCAPGPGDNKGLLTITRDELRFYESVGVPSPNTQADADSISGDFRFTGEGQTWTKFQSLQLRGRELLRTDSNPTASFSYAKCS